MGKEGEKRIRQNQMVNSLECRVCTRFIAVSVSRHKHFARASLCLDPFTNQSLIVFKYSNGLFLQSKSLFFI